MTHGQMMERIADLMIVGRPKLRLAFSLTPIAAPVAAAVAGEDVGLIEPADGVPGIRPAAAATCSRRGVFGVRLHTFDAAVERALRDLEAHTGGPSPMSDDAVTADITIDAPPEKVWDTGHGRRASR